MFIHDGFTPSLQQIEDYCQVADAAWNDGAIAVHCRAGLGRTGTMIASFLIRRFSLDALHVIAFLRLMRAGMILSVQGDFLVSIQYLLRGEDTPEPIAEHLKTRYSIDVDSYRNTDDDEFSTSHEDIVIDITTKVKVK